MQLAGKIIDYRQFVGQHQQNIRRPEQVFFLTMLFQFKFLLDVAHRVVAEITCQPTGKSQCAFYRRGVKALAILFDKRQRVLDEHMLQCLRLAASFGAHNGAFLALHPQPFMRGQTDDRVTTKALAANDGFEQIGKWFVGELEIDRQRRIEIRKGLKRNRDSVIALCSERRELSFVHDFSAEVVVEDSAKQRRLIS